MESGPQLVDLRGPCGRFLGQLDTEQGIVVQKCRACSKREGREVYHGFDRATGQVVELLIVWQNEGTGQPAPSL